MRSCEMVFIHLFLCLRRFRLETRIRLMQWSSSRRWTCPYHLSLDSRILSVMQQTPTAWRISSFLFLSFSVIPSIHRSILILWLGYVRFFKYVFLSANKRGHEVEDDLELWTVSHAGDGHGHRGRGNQPGSQWVK